MIAKTSLALMKLESSARELLWQEWDDVYIVYQPSSTETHVFNGTTALILESLEQGPLSMEEVMDCIRTGLEAKRGDLDPADISFAVARLEELGLIAWSDPTPTPP